MSLKKVVGRHFCLVYVITMIFGFYDRTKEQNRFQCYSTPSFSTWCADIILLLYYDSPRDFYINGVEFWRRKKRIQLFILHIEDSLHWKISSNLSRNIRMILFSPKFRKSNSTKTKSLDKMIVVALKLFKASTHLLIYLFKLFAINNWQISELDVNFN